MSSVMWPPLHVGEGDAALTIRVATLADVPMLERWDVDPDVIACTSDDPNAEQAFGGAIWPDEIAANSDVSCYYIVELAGRPIAGMQVIDPHLEPTHYWGESEPNRRAIDIWIGDAGDRNGGHGARMMRAVIDQCFADPAVTAIIIDPLNSNRNAHRFYQRLGFKVIGRRFFEADDCLVHRLDREDWESADGA
ncbi:MAG TPA: GNAT family N-acetyltransferase [Terricaulis sp.]|nr:GNAT family N-acetyltransferase [Terricaulis sp.]HRP12491.1 GNAT family N-acetyltransferase [Terricaulis sp.]